MTTTTMAAAPALGQKAQAELNRRERNRQIRGMLFASPFWLGFLLFTAVPMLASIYFSFTNYSILTPPKWAGLKNYLELPTDPILLKALWNTVAYSVLAVPLGVGLGLVVALLLNQKVKGVAVWRTIYYLPSITPVVAYAVLWRWMLSRDYGIINSIIGVVGIPPIDWLGSEFWIIIAYVMTGLWSIGGTMIVNLAGLQSIPTDLMDAAKVDGAGPASVFRHVTLPMMTPVLFYNVIMGIVGAMQSFTFFYTLTQGNGNTSYTEIGSVYMIYLYRVAFQLYRMGYGSAMAWLLFVIIMALTLLVVRTSRRWVYYEGEWITGNQS
jgi:multiple sugar transport system permease protein